MTGENESSLLPEETVDPRNHESLIIRGRRTARLFGWTALTPHRITRPASIRSLPPIHRDRLPREVYEFPTQPRPTVPVGDSESDSAQHSTADAPRSEAPLL